MNKFIGTGRLTRDPEIRYAQNENSTCIARYGLAVNRRFVRDGEQDCDFLNCVAFGKNGEFVEKYLKKGMKIAIVGRIQTGNYTNKDGVKVYTADIVVEEHEFCESKGNSEPIRTKPSVSAGDGFMYIPDGLEDEELPFN